MDVVTFKQLIEYILADLEKSKKCKTQLILVQRR
jgi:hypothetical protein